MAKSTKRIEFTAKEIDQIEIMSGLGISIDKIGLILGFSKNTFLRRYQEGDETLVNAVDRGRTRAEKEVTQSAYEQAISGKVPAMTMFWLKCRAGWRENPERDKSKTEELLESILEKTIAEQKKRTK